MEQVTPITLTNGNKDNRRTFRKMGFALLMLTVVWILGQNFLAGGLSIFAPELLENEIVYYAVSYAPLYLMAFPTYALLMRRVPKARLESRPLGFGNTLGAFSVCVFLMYLGNFIGILMMQYINSATGVVTENELVEMLSETNPYIIFVIVVICAPIVEELIFRKLLIDRAARYGEGIAVIMSGLLFGLYHMNLYQFFYAFLLGVVFAYVYVRTGRIRYSIAFHMIINFMGSVAAPYMLKNINSITSMDALSDDALSQIMSVLPGLLLSLAYVFLLLLLVFAGFIMLIIYTGTGKLKFRTGEIVIPAGKKISTVYFNVWTILLVAFCLLMTAISAMGDYFWTLLGV